MGLISDLLSRFAGEPAEDYGHRYVGGNTGPIMPDEEYVRVWLRSARIVNIRSWAQKIYPAVHGRFVYADPVFGMREIVAVISPSKTFQELDSRHLDRFITVNQPLLGPIPFRGELSSEVALFSVTAENLAKPYLDLLSNLTSTASVSFFGSIEPLVAPIKQAAEFLLLDPGRAELEIGLARTDTTLVGGNIVVARTAKAGFGLAGVTIDPDDYRLLDKAGKPVSDFPYMVLGIERVTQRADFRSIPEIGAGWKSVMDRARQGAAVNEIADEFAKLKRIVALSADLVPADRTRVLSVLSGELRQAGLLSDEAAAGVAVEAVIPPSQPEAVVVTTASEHGGPRLSLSEARRLVLDPETPDYVVRSLFKADPAGSRPFSPSIVFDPAVVAVSEPQPGAEGARVMNWANELASWRRRNEFLEREREGDRRPVLVSVGDSWFQFPVFLRDVIDQLGQSYNIWSLDAAGDTLADMVREQRHLVGLRRWTGRAQALLLSGSGNDIVGEDSDGRSVLTKILRTFEAGRPADWYVDTGEFRRRLDAVKSLFEEVFAAVEAEFPGVPVLCHGYDFAIPAYPGDPRDPLWARRDEWLTGPMVAELGIHDATLRREIVHVLIDRLNEMLAGLCGGDGAGAHRNAWHVDLRNQIGDRWSDELHPTDHGFEDAGRSFHRVLDAALAGSREATATAAARGLETVPAEPSPVFTDSEAEESKVEVIAAAAIAEGAAVEAAAKLAISERATDLIIQHETGGRQYYDTVLRKRPVWPSAASGVTIGFGYDLGYVAAAEFARDWAYLAAADRQRLAPLVGKHGGNTSTDTMRALTAGVADIRVEWSTADLTFRTATLPKFCRATDRALPNCAELSADSAGALVSLTLNRGASYSKPFDPTRDPKDRYREMRAIRAAMAERRFTDIPPLIRLMKRIWRGTTIEQEMIRRRENEAKLFEAGLSIS